MNEQLENGKNLNETDITSSSLKNDQNQNNETVNASTSEDVSNTENVETPSLHGILERVGLSSANAEDDNLTIAVDETLNLVEVDNPEIRGNEGIENSQQSVPSEIEDSSTLREIVGDDFSKKSEVDILCECEPNVAGAAVPTVKSFIPTESHKSVTKCDNNSCKLPGSDLKQTGNSTKHASALQRHNDVAKHVSRIRQKYKDDVKGNPNSDNCGKKFKCSPQTNHCLRYVMEKPDLEMKSHSKIPSLIPKLSRPGSSNNKNLDVKDNTEKRESIKSDNQKIFSKSSNNCAKMKGKQTTQLPKNNPKDTKGRPENFEKASSNANHISSRMVGFQQKIKATTSIDKQKIELDKSKDKILPEENSTDSSTEGESNNDLCTPSKKMVADLYKSIFCLKDIASTLSENSTLKRQTNKHIEKLFSNIAEIKLIADKLFPNGQPNSEEDVVVHDDNSKVLAEKEKSPRTSATNAKDKIYIKFMHAKDRKGDNKKKSKEAGSDQSEEVPTDVSLSLKLTSESINSDPCITEKSQEENKIKEADSMDGVFIPSFEPPRNLEEDDETNGLDITITFPEFSQLYSNGTESHLSVCLSDISAEALRKLKRCPKDFTLKMDFVEGKILFQSGRGPANNFQIGPDLKFAENFVDTKKSDVISIKPSTECSFGSQMIPVDNPKEIKSFKSLKSTDSELFNVVSLPFLYKNPYLATSHKSCMAFRNDQIMSMAIIAKHFFKSMPQIPSLTNIFEDAVMESPSKIDSRKETKKSPESKKVD